MRRTHSTILIASLLFAGCGGPEEEGYADAEDALLRSSVYNQIGAVEQLFAVPQTAQTIVMGSFNVASTSTASAFQGTAASCRISPAFS